MNRKTVAGQTPILTRTRRIEFRQQKERRKSMTLQNMIPAHPFSSFISAVLDLRERAAERRKTKAAYTKTRDELSEMSSRELADIGIHRSEIPRIAAEAANIQ
jgi:uncharacterized protein YjiS (DUF1127 family)